MLVSPKKKPRLLLLDLRLGKLASLGLIILWSSVLKAGGNAVDAAIAAELCIGVINMFSAGMFIAQQCFVWLPI